MPRFKKHRKTAGKTTTVGSPVTKVKTTLPSYVYLLYCDRTGDTYIGATVNLDQRLRKHNAEISQGAKQTTQLARRVLAQETAEDLYLHPCWRRVAYVSNFPTWRDALQFEWKWRQQSRRDRRVGNRLAKLRVLLTECDRSCKTSTPFASWPTPMAVTCEYGC